MNARLEGTLRFEIVAKASRLDQLRSEMQAVFKANHRSAGDLVCYSMPALPPALPRLLTACNTTAFRERCKRVHYYFETKEGHIRELTPMAHYVQSASQAIARKRFALERGARGVRSALCRLVGAHRDTRELSPRTGQPRIQARTEVYELEEALSVFLFFARSIPDNLCPLLHSLMGQQFVSFSDYLKFMLREDHLGSDLEMEKHLSENMEWFGLLRDIRDWVTHAGSIDIVLHEDPNTSALAVSMDRFMLRPVSEIVTQISDGLATFIAFFDEHYALAVAEPAE